MVAKTKSAAGKVPKVHKGFPVVVTGPAQSRGQATQSSAPEAVKSSAAVEAEDPEAAAAAERNSKKARKDKMKSQAAKALLSAALRGGKKV